MRPGFGLPPKFLDTLIGKRVARDLSAGHPRRLVDLHCPRTPEECSTAPSSSAFGGVVAWIVIWLLTPVDVVGYLAPGALVYAGVCYVFLAVGALYAQRAQPERGPSPAQSPWSARLQSGLFWGTAAIGLFGMGMRLFDRLYLRNAQYGANALEFRDTLSTTAVTPVGAIAATLFPFCLIPLLLLLGSRGARAACRCFWSRSPSS